MELKVSTLLHYQQAGIFLTHVSAPLIISRLLQCFTAWADKGNSNLVLTLIISNIK